MRKTTEEKLKFSSKGIILDIASMRSYAKNLLGKGKSYEELLKYLLDKDYYNDENLRIPAVKDLSTELRISYAKIKSQLESIYYDLIYADHQFEFNEIEYYFGLHNYAFQHRKKQVINFFVKSLPFIPRIGEAVEIPFFKEYLGCDFFFVENIIHQFSFRKMSVYIQLQGGFYNKYWHIRKDKAKVKEELPFMDFYKLEDRELMEKLKVRQPIRIQE